MLRWKSSLKPAAAAPSDDNPGTTNLVGDWSMDETSGTRADSHGSNDLTDNNTVGYATGVISNAASFTAANSESLSSSTQPVTGTGARAAELWFKTSSTAGMCITSYGANGTGTWWRVNIENGVIWQRIAAGAISWSNTWNDGNWHHLVMQVAASSTLNDVVLYIDGTLQTHATSNTRPITTGSGDFYIGADSSGAFFDGDIDEVRYWDRVLTADEITWLYNSGSGKSYSDISGGVEFDLGFNFRATSGYVTDPVGTTYVNEDVYPTTRAGATFGWETTFPSGQSRNRSLSQDPRLAGIHYVVNGTANEDFRVDLPATGSYDVHLAIGDASSNNRTSLLILDDSTTKITIADKQVSATQWYDATDTARASSALWVSNETAVSVTFATTIMRLRLVAPSTQSSVIAHLRLVKT